MALAMAAFAPPWIDAAIAQSGDAPPAVSASELRSQPRYVSGDRPEDAPAVVAAVSDGRSGRIVVEATVTPAGKLIDPVFVQPSGDTAIDQAVIAALSSWKLTPGRDKAGKPVAARAKFPFSVGGAKRLLGTQPEFPDAAKALGHNGKVVARGTIDAEGKLVDVRIEESSRSPLLDEAVLAALAAWQFRPTKDFAGQPRSQEVLLPFEFNQAAGGGDNYLAAIKTYRCAAFIKETDWWVGAHPEKKLSDYPLYKFIGGLQLITPELLGPPPPAGAKMSAGYLRHPAQWTNATSRCRAALDSTFLAEYRKG
ncbi:energy transducer TonB [Sphingopyxis panaciterrae]